MTGRGRRWLCLIVSEWGSGRRASGFGDGDGYYGAVRQRQSVGMKQTTMSGSETTRGCVIKGSPA